MEIKINFETLKKFWKNKKVFITGHTGFKGTWICLMLNLLNSNIYGCSLKPLKKSLFNQTKINKYLKGNFFVDIRNIKILKKKLHDVKPEIIFHLAAQPLVTESFKDPVKTFDTNILGTVNLLECIRDLKSVKSVVIITTDKVYKIKKRNKMYSERDELGGVDPYSSSKVGAEIVTASFIKSYFIKTNLKNRISTARAGNVIGGGDYSKNRLIPDIINSINRKKKLIVRNPSHVRPWQYVIEPLLGYLLLAEKQYKGKIVNRNFSWNFGPAKIGFKTVKYVVNEIKKFHKIKFSTKKNGTIKETTILKLNSSKAKKYLNWSSLWNINRSLKQVIEWNYLAKKDDQIKTICENQILMYLKEIQSRK